MSWRSVTRTPSHGRVATNAWSTDRRTSSGGPMGSLPSGTVDTNRSRPSGRLGDRQVGDRRRIEGSRIGADGHRTPLSSGTTLGTCTVLNTCTARNTCTALSSCTAPVPVLPSVPVLLRLVGAAQVDAEVGGLLVRELAQSDAELVEMQAGHLLV